MVNSYGVEDILDKFKYLGPRLKKQIDSYGNKYGALQPGKEPYQSLTESVPELNQSPEKLYQQLTAPSDISYLDKILFGMDDKEKAKFLDELIQKRESLKYKMRDQIEREKDSCRELLFKANYGFLPANHLKDISRIYGTLKQLSIAEEVQCWKDTSLLQLKKLEEGLLGGETEDEA